MSQTLFQPSSFSAGQQKEILTQQLEFLENQVKNIRKRIEDVEKEE